MLDTLLVAELERSDDRRLSKASYAGLVLMLSFDVEE